MHCYVCYRFVIGSCLKSVLRYKCIILVIFHPDTLCLCEQGCEDLWSFLKVKRGSAKRKSLENTDTDERCKAAIKPKAFSVLLDAYRDPSPPRLNFRVWVLWTSHHCIHLDPQQSTLPNTEALLQVTV